MSRAIGRELKAGDEIVVTRLDHDANVSPWVALEERGVVIREVDIDVEDCTLDMDDLRRQINQRTKLVAVGYASNAVGTINDVAEVTRLAHSVGALIVYRCGALCAAWPDRCAGDRLRFPGLLAIQILRSTRRNALRQARAPPAAHAYKVRPATKSYRTAG